LQHCAVLWVITDILEERDYAIFRVHTAYIMKMEMTGSSQTLVSTHKATQCHSPGYQNLNIHCCENLRYYPIVSHITVEYCQIDHVDYCLLGCDAVYFGK
jgi:hypothetical protein